jgi:hypothetical protein
MIAGIAVAYILFLIIGIAICAQLYPFAGGQDGLKNFGVVSTVVVAAISGIMTAIVSLYTLHRNNLGQIALKRLEDELLNKREFVKGTKEAYQALLAAATTAHANLIKLQSGDWGDDQKRAMEKAFTKVASQIIYMRNEDDENTWLKIQHRGMYLAERAEELPNKTEQSAFWRTQSQPFSEALSTFKQRAQEEIRRGTELENKNATAKPA